MTTYIHDVYVEGFERVVNVVNEDVGLYGYIALHNTVLGPGLGGVRHMTYSSGQQALDDVLALSRAMTLKSSLAGINYGGGKAVIMEMYGKDRGPIYRAFGEAVEMLDGSYIAVGDVGTSPSDLHTVRESTAHCAGLTLDSGIPTAKGILYAIQAYMGREDLLPEETTIGVSGLGKVGGNLAFYLGQTGMKELYMTDISQPAVHRIQQEWTHNNTTIHYVGYNSIHSLPCEIFSPCALGSAVTRTNRMELNCNAIIGGANNIVDSEETIRFLHRRGITYVPDFLVNAGGVLALAVEIENRMHDLDRELEMIGERVDEVLSDAAYFNTSPWVSAMDIATARVVNGRQ